MKHLLFLLSLTLLITPATHAADIVAIAWPWGTYRIDPATGDTESIGSPGNTQMNSLARNDAGEFVAVDNDGNLVQLDSATGATTLVVALSFGGSTPTVPAVAFSPAGTLFAIGRQFPDTLYTVDVSTGLGTLVGELGAGFTVQGLAFSPSGKLFGWDINRGLVTINVSTGAATDVNTDEGATASLQCLAFSPEEVLYGAQYGLFTIDPTTGVPTEIGSASLSDIRGMEFDTGAIVRLTVEKIEAGMRICFQTEPGSNYQLERRNRFAGGVDWISIGSGVPGTGDQICFTNQFQVDQRFFRVNVTNP